MMVGMVADLVTFGYLLAYQVRRLLGALADHKEGRLNVIFAQDREKLRCIGGVWAVVERQRDLSHLRRSTKELAVAYSVRELGLILNEDRQDALVYLFLRAPPVMVLGIPDKAGVRLKIAGWGCSLLSSSHAARAGQT